MALAMITISSCSSRQDNQMKNFKSEKISRTASILINGQISAVYPLFGAFEESKWERDWSPELIYPDYKVIEEGTTFKTKGHSEESEFLWRVSKFEPEKYIIQYLVSTQNRYWTITVCCKQTSDDRTMAEVTYSFIGLNEKGNQFNRLALKNMYKQELLNWEKALNHYLEFGSPL